MRYYRAIVLVFMLEVLTGCGLSRPKPNAEQTWGVWSHVPGTESYRARRAEKKEDRVEEAKKQLTKATEELVNEAQKDVRTNAALTAAGMVAKQNVHLHGNPDKPIDTGVLISTNTAARDAAWEELLKAFGRQQEDLAYIRKALDKERAIGAASVKQDSSAAATAWDFKQAALRWFLGNWYLAILAVLALWYVAKTAARIYFPPVAIGMNVAEDFGNAAVRRGFTQLVEAGEKFKHGLDRVVDDDDLRAKIKEHFRVSQERTQDRITQDAIKALTEKG